jgi:hypothetical protein
MCIANRPTAQSDEECPASNADFHPDCPVPLKGVALKQGSKRRLFALSPVPHDMTTKALFVKLEAKPGKENEVAKFLRDGQGLVQQEPATTGTRTCREKLPRR